MEKVQMLIERLQIQEISQRDKQIIQTQGETRYGIRRTKVFQRISYSNEYNAEQSESEKTKTSRELDEQKNNVNQRKQKPAENWMNKRTM